MLGSQKIELTPFLLRPLLDYEGWDFDIIGDKLLDAIDTPSFSWYQRLSSLIQDGG
jgi:hypothetical protein